MSKRIYIAGKVTGLPLESVKQKFALKEWQLKSQGYDVMNPVKYIESRGLLNEAWEYIMKVLIPILCCADELHLLPCWQHSRGAMLERDIALRLGMPIIYP